MKLPSIPSVSYHPVHVHAIKVPSPGRVPAPKLVGIRLKPVSNGIKVTHRYQGSANKTFVFTNPELMDRHLRRAVSNEWLSSAGAPAEASKVDKTLDIGG